MVRKTDAATDEPKTENFPTIDDAIDTVDDLEEGDHIRVTYAHKTRYHLDDYDTTTTIDGYVTVADTTTDDPRRRRLRLEFQSSDPSTGYTGAKYRIKTGGVNHDDDSPVFVSKSTGPSVRHFDQLGRVDTIDVVDDPSCEACDRDDLSTLPDDDGRGAYRCEWCGAFVDEDGRLPRADDKRCPKCDGPVAYGVLKDARKGIRGHLCVGECDERRIVRPADGAPVATDGGRDYADAKEDEVDVVREALRDATDDDLDALFGEVADYARTAEMTPARVDVVVVPAMVARKGLRDGFGSWHFDRDGLPIPGDGGERVVFHVHRDDDVHSIRNRVLQALTPTEPPRHA